VIALNAGGRYLFASSEEGDIEVYDMPRGIKAGNLRTDGDVIDVAFDGHDCLLVGLFDGSLQEWSVRQCRILRIRSAGPSLCCLDLSDRCFFAAPGEEAALNELLIWNRRPEEGKPPEKPAYRLDHQFGVTAVCAIPGSARSPFVATGSADSFVRVFDYTKGANYGLLQVLDTDPPDPTAAHC